MQDSTQRGQADGTSMHIHFPTCDMPTAYLFLAEPPTAPGAALTSHPGKQAGLEACRRQRCPPLANLLPRCTHNVSHDQVQKATTGHTYS